LFVFVCIILGFPGIGVIVEEHGIIGFRPPWRSRGGFPATPCPIRPEWNWNANSNKVPFLAEALAQVPSGIPRKITSRNSSHPPYPVSSENLEQCKPQIGKFKAENRKL